MASNAMRARNAITDGTDAERALSANARELGISQHTPKSPDHFTPTADLPADHSGLASLLVLVKVLVVGIGIINVGTVELFHDVGEVLFDVLRKVSLVKGASID